MVRSTRKFVVVGAIVVAALLVTAAQSEACWGWGCYQPVSYYTPYYASWGCSPCYTGCNTCYSGCYSCYDACYSACYTWPVRRCLLGPYRWYYAGGCCDYGCGCGYGACCGSCGTSCCGGAATESGDAPDQTAPTAAPPQNEQPATDAAPMMDTKGTVLPGLDTSAGLPTRQNSGLLTVWVPANAKVFINGQETTTQGSRRRYVSHGLKPGLTYKYEVRAEIVRNGMVAEEQKTVYLTAGAAEGVAFGFNRVPSNQVAAQ